MGPSAEASFSLGTLSLGSCCMRMVSAILARLSITAGMERALIVTTMAEKSPPNGIIIKMFGLWKTDVFKILSFKTANISNRTTAILFSYYLI